MIIDKLLDGQYRRPTGLIGRYVGSQMAQQHQPENLWTVSLLDAQPNEQILEVGFGPGVAIAALARLVTSGRVVGLDFSKTMVGVARQRNAEAIKAGRIELKYGEVSHLPFAENAFDKAFAIHNIYFWPKPIEGLKELWRVLKPNGVLIVTVLPKDKWPTSNGSTQLGTPECTPYSGDEIAQMMAAAGFSRTRLAVDPEAKSPSSFSVIGAK